MPCFLCDVKKKEPVRWFLDPIGQGVKLSCCTSLLKHAKHLIQWDLHWLEALGRVTFIRLTCGTDWQLTKTVENLNTQSVQTEFHKDRTEAHTQYNQNHIHNHTMLFG